MSRKILTKVASFLGLNLSISLASKLSWATVFHLWHFTFPLFLGQFHRNWSICINNFSLYCPLGTGQIWTEHPWSPSFLLAVLSRFSTKTWKLASPYTTFYKSWEQYQCKLQSYAANKLNAGHTVLLQMNMLYWFIKWPNRSIYSESKEWWLLFSFMLQNKGMHGPDSFQSVLTQRDAAKGFMRQLTAHSCHRGKLIPFYVPSQLHIPATHTPPVLSANVIPHLRPLSSLTVRKPT